MVFHKTLSTLPIGCFSNIYNSIIDNQPDLKWLMILPESDYISQTFPPEPLPDNLFEVYESMFFEMKHEDSTKERLELDTYMEALKLLEFAYRRTEPDNREKITEIVNEKTATQLKLWALPPVKDATKMDIDSICTDIELSFKLPPIQIYSYSTAKFFSLINKIQKQNGTK